MPCPPLVRSPPYRCSPKRCLCVSPRRIFAKNRIERSNEEIGVLFGEDEWRPEFQHVVMRAVCAGQNATVAEAVHDVGSLARRWGTRFAINHEIYAEKEPGTTD